MYTFTLRRGKAESLKRFHPWVFSGAIDRCDGKPQEGDVVRVVSHEGEMLGYGHCQIGSIAVRMLTFSEEPVDDAFWQQRLAEAFRMRKALQLSGREDNNIYRLVHGEGDRLPGLVVDVYGRTAVMQAHSVGMHVSRETIAKALVAASKGLIDNVYYKSETTLPYKADLHGENGFLIGNDEGNVATENGLRFHIDWLHGQKTGFFVDQRENRALLEHYAPGRNVLNMFCYTGGFSVYALRGGANLVHSVDASAKAIELTRANVELNFPGDQRHEAYTADAFKYLEEAGNNYDLIVLDPPAFAKHRDALRNALKGYTRLNAMAFRKIKPGGILFTFSCSQAVSKEQFRLAVFTAATQSGRHVRILHQLHQPADHPINIYHPEGEYLKGLVLYVE
ncbi:MAG: class I SAM-dependent rRNA methyltransferase [Bacteroidales bacterium]|nr:class I SAM-dependent rRNA methyltransferase [Bacteroidales bacterium]MDD6731381.1 class I SAM-dependent rRNA methyltransferase [Bacteroidales bacterium]MDY4558482.1 class I SAM-dependent rRNA methyltransferase [Alloprevotella sp.]